MEDAITAIRHNSPLKSPITKQFLMKDSNITNYAAFDVDSRVDDIETQFKELKQMMNSSLTEKKGQEDALALVKTRGKHMCQIYPYLLIM